MTENGSSLNPSPSSEGISRKDFIKTSAAAGVGIAALAASGNYAFAQGSDRIKVGVIGCGGRGTGAAENHLDSSEGVELIAMGDMFPDRLKESRQNLESRASKDAKWGAKFKVKDDHCFTGFDAYKKVLATDIDLVILATPPGFRPIHIRAALEAGKHVFAEKPVAVDGPGIRSVMESGAIAGKKKLAFVTGTQRRHQAAYMETINRIHDGAIGDVLTAQVYWNQGSIWNKGRKPEWTDTEWQLRNWYYFTYLCGDHIVEQHVHNLDVANWVLNAHPVKALGIGGRQVRTDPAYGHIYDHFTVEYEYPNGVKILSMCRQQDNTASKVDEFVVGSKGTSSPSGKIKGPQPFRFDGDTTNPYVVEHRDLVNSIRSGKLLNEAQRIAESTLTAIMGRMSCYTGQEITWDMALNSKEVLMPEGVKKGEWGKLPVPPVSQPGITPFI